MIRLFTVLALALAACGMLPDNRCYAPHVIDTYDASTLSSSGYGPQDIGKTVQVPVQCGTFGTVAK